MTPFRGHNFGTRTNVHGFAAQEYRFALDWYRKRDAGVAARFRDAVDAAANRILNDPDSHSEIVDGIRSVRLRSFPYILVFAWESGESVLIPAVAHAKRRTGYGKRRHKLE